MRGMLRFPVRVMPRHIPREAFITRLKLPPRRSLPEPALFTWLLTTFPILSGTHSERIRLCLISRRPRAPRTFST